MRAFRAATIAGLLVTAGLGTGPLWGQEAVEPSEIEALHQEIESLKRGQQLILRELQDLRRALSSATRSGRDRQRFQPTDLSIAGASFLGERDAPVTLVEFSDYQCPFCRRHYLTTMKALKSEFIETGKIKYVMKEFPIPSLHPAAVKASEAALCAGDQDGYWPMHDRIFENQKQMRIEDFVRHATDIGLDGDELANCLENGTYADAIRKDIALGKRLGVRGTPSFFIAITDREDPDKVRAVQFIPGAAPAETFRQLIEATLAKANES